MEPELFSGGQLAEKKKKKKKKRKADHDEALAESQRFLPSAKKQRQESEDKTQCLDKLARLEESAPAADGSLSHENPRKKRKKRKVMATNGDEEASPIPAKKAKDSPIEEVPNTKMENGVESPPRSGASKEKKKNKHKKRRRSEEAMSEDTANQDARGFEGLDENNSDSCFVKKKKKCKKNKSDSGCIDRVEDGLESTDSSEKKKKKHKKKDTVETDASISGTETIQNDSEQTQTKKKHKKDKSKGSDQTLPIGNTAFANESTGESHLPAAKEKKDKKKKSEKNSSGTQEKCPALDAEVNPMNKDNKEKKGEGKKETKKHSKKQKSYSSASDNEPTANNHSNEVSKTDASEPARNHNSNPTQAAPASATSFGQWSSDMFESSERQSKFLRLLGGFRKAGDNSASSAVTPESGKKKGLFGSLQLQQEASAGGQRALTYQGAQEMNKRLESDYERALTFSVRGQRGVGLGFTPDPAAGKKFHIDINKKASKKFED